MTAPKALACCIDVARTYGAGRAAVVALHGATCSIDAGDQIGIVGPSGSGKSTLLSILSGLETPTAGQVSWPALGDRAALRPGPVGVIFQGPSLLPPLNVIENVALPLLLFGTDRAAAIAAAHRALARLDLDALAKQLPEELSGGQAQRVAVARVLAGTPRLILADEPTGQLDHRSAVDVVDALIETATSTGAALVVSTHDEVLAARLPRRWEMTDGRLRTETTRKIAESVAHPCSA